MPRSVMRLWLALTFACLWPLTAIAACEGRDLRLDLSDEARAELDAVVADIPFAEGNHWIATKGATRLHLIGTMHTNDPRMDDIVARLTPTLSQADVFYFEVTTADMQAFQDGLARDLSPIMLTSGPTLIDLVEPEVWNSLTARLAQRGIPGWMAAKMRPWFMAMMLSIPPCLTQNPEADNGMDKRLSDLAEAQGIPQRSLERVEDLIALFDRHPLEDQVQSIIRLGGALNTSDDQMVTLANGYLDEKHAEIIAFARLQARAASDEPAEVFDEEWAAFEDQMLIQRNADWMEHILAIEDQTAVIAVGAGHLAHEHGLLHQLEQAGYHLERAEF